MKLFSKAAEKIKASPFIIPITIVFLVMFVNSIGLSSEDYFTSYEGYMAFPTRKALTWVAFLVAMLPQIVQIGMSFVFIEDTNKRWALLIAGIAHGIDIITDVWFKININNVTYWEYIPIALLEAWGIYTLGSELMLTVSFGMVIKLWPDFWREVNNIVSPIFDLFKRIFYGLVPDLDEGEDNKKDNYKQVNVRKIDKTQRQYNRDDNEKRGRGRPRKYPEENDSDFGDYSGYLNVLNNG